MHAFVVCSHIISQLQHHVDWPTSQPHENPHKLLKTLHQAATSLSGFLTAHARLQVHLSFQTDFSEGMKWPLGSFVGRWWHIWGFYNLGNDLGGGTCCERPPNLGVGVAEWWRRLIGGDKTVRDLIIMGRRSAHNDFCGCGIDTSEMPCAANVHFEIPTKLSFTIRGINRCCRNGGIGYEGMA